MRKILIFIVAFNAEKTINDVINRIELDPDKYDIEILVIDDASQDSTFERALELRGTPIPYKFTVLKNPVNQGYGGNQKLGYQYALGRGHDVVVLLHGDGQYAPECIETLIAPIVKNEADVVFGSRMITKGEALKGGMPLYKFTGNKILTGIQNFLLRTKLSEFHSGYRVYSVAALRKIPFEFNTNDFHFDTQIIIQAVALQLRIKEKPIPTYYGDEICYVDGVKYAWNVIKSTVAYVFHKAGIFYQFHYDLQSDEVYYSPKVDYLSSHSLAIASVQEKSMVFDLGCGPSLVPAGILTRQKSCKVYGLDLTKPENSETYADFFVSDLDRDELPELIGQADVVLMLDILEHLKNPEEFLLRLRSKCGLDTKILISVPNVAFLPVRFLLFFGRFNYGKAGILDKRHTRLFTYYSLKKILKQGGFIIEKIRGVPAPFPKALGNNRFARFLLQMNRAAIFFLKKLFSYQFFASVRPYPMARSLLNKTIASSQSASKKILHKDKT
jgi:glycosyltransferase involved in cell wall biosynthesis